MKKTFRQIWAVLKQIVQTGALVAKEASILKVTQCMSMLKLIGAFQNGMHRGAKYGKSVNNLNIKPITNRMFK